MDIRSKVAAENYCVCQVACCPVSRIGCPPSHGGGFLLNNQLAKNISRESEVKLQPKTIAYAKLPAVRWAG